MNHATELRAGPADTPAPAAQSRFAAWLLHPALGLRLALISTLLVSPALFIGFHLDDYVHRYLLSGLPGSAELLHAYQSPFGIANGDPATNHWQVEAGYAPWWIHPHLLISLYRPISAASHWLDARLWPNSAFLQHAHSLLWSFALVLAVTALYRRVMGATTVAGVAALLYAFDQTHGLAIGWIANRNALIAALLGVLALACHHRARVPTAQETPPAPSGTAQPASSAAPRASLYALLAPALLLCALLAGEGAVAIFGYLLAHALCVERGPLKRRALGLVPYLVVIAAWQLGYHALGRGARFSGLYLDPVREPLRFAAAVLVRAPLLLLGQFSLPTAESPLFLPALARPIWAWAVVLALWLAVSIAPLVRSNRVARFWALGMLLSLVPACTTHPNNRLLFFTGLGAMALLSQLWHALLQPGAAPLAGAAWRRLATGFATVSVGFHMLLSPLLLPLSACGIAFTSQAESAARTALAQGAGKDLVLVSSPDYFYVKLVPVLSALEQRSPPHSLRALSFGAVPLRIHRPDARTLDVEFGGGLLSEPLLELYRARELSMPVGTRVQLSGMTIEVTHLTVDGRVAAARFRFDAPLDAPRYRFLCWAAHSYEPCPPPPVGAVREVAPAGLELGL